MNKHKISILIIVVFLMTVLVFTGCSSQTKEEAFSTYKDNWESKDYEKMYGMLSTDSKKYISKEDFITRYTNIYDGIGAKDINIELNEEQDKEDTLKFKLKMDSVAGEMKLEDFNIEMVEEERDGEKKWYVKWDESLIFPEMSKEDKVRVETLYAERGEIYDKFGNGLAVNGTRYNIGIYPKLFEENKESNISNMANILDIDKELIEDKLDKNTNPEYFIPIVKLSVDDTKLSQLLDIKGVKHQEVKERVYPGGEAFGALIGYTGSITAEELEKDKEGIYNSTSIVGKLGLESVHEKSLRSKDGKEIYISKINDGEEIDKVVLAKTRPEDGKDLKLSIDMDLQKKIYNEMDGSVGASVAIHPITGEVLSMVSSPSFDSNLFTTYISKTQSKEWEDTEVNEFQNRFNDAYSPGSTFKLVTADIALDKNSINPSEKLSINGKQWQKDNSWGDYKVTRVSDKISNVNLNDAFVYSDNIYFAMAALEIGEKNFIEESKKFGFDEDIPVNYPIEKSQIANENNIENEILLANTGYGQGEVLVSPLHLSLIYSSVLNDGNIMKPILEQGEGVKSEIWKKDVITDKNIDILREGLINVIEDENGTGNEAKLDGIKLAGKTGTAELKSSQSETGKENGWFVAMDVDNPELLVSMIIEGVEDKGGSHYVVPRVKNIMEYYIK